MTQQEKEELNDLRRENQILKSKYQRMESETIDTRMDLEALLKHQKGRWIGFVLFTAATCIVGLILYSYSKVQDLSLSENFASNPINAINFSISTTIITFAGVLEFFLTIFTLRSGLITISELGTSSFARALARRRGVRNYPQAIKDTEQLLVLQYKELNEIRRDIGEISGRLKALEEKETPWYET